MFYSPNSPTPMNNINEKVRQRKAALRARLSETRGLIRQDIRDLKEDLNPLQTAGRVVKNLLTPNATEASAGSPLLKFGVNTGLSMLAGRILPGIGPKAVRAVAPLLIDNVATHVAPKARKTAARFLRWVADKTAPSK